MDLGGCFSGDRKAKHGLVGLVPLLVLVLVPLPLLQIAKEEIDLRGCFSGRCFSGHRKVKHGLVGLEEHGNGLDEHGLDVQDGLVGLGQRA